MCHALCYLLRSEDGVCRVYKNENMIKKMGKK